MHNFRERMREPQAKYKTKALCISEQGKWRGKHYTHILPEVRWQLNLWDGIRKEAQLYFSDNQIAWHRDRHNLLSSQVLCVNIFFPLRKHPHLLKPWLSHHFDVESICDLDFEYIGPEGNNYFNEKGGRGQNRTSSDLSITWRDGAKRKNMLLLEFKFTESNFGECSKKDNTNPERCRSSEKIVASPKTQCYRAKIGRKYWDKILDNDSPFRREVLTTERFCPFRYDFYQLMRNQLLAHCIRSDSTAGFDRVEFGVIYHADNEDLLRMSHPFAGERNPLKVWPSLLRNPDTFHAFTIQGSLNTIDEGLPEELVGWRTYLRQRYGL